MTRLARRFGLRTIAFGYLAAILLGMASHVPGGVGIFEGLMVLWLRPWLPAAALLPIARWAPFNLTLLVPGTSPYDQHRMPQRVLGMPAALLSQDLIAATAAAGLFLRRLARSRA